MREFYTEPDLDSAELIDLIEELEGIADEMHWSRIIGNDLISDYLSEELDRMHEKLDHVEWVEAGRPKIRRGE